MGFGICNAPPTFQLFIMAIFFEYIEDILQLFMDDFCVHGSTFDNYLKICLSVAMLRIS